MARINVDYTRIEKTSANDNSYGLLDPKSASGVISTEEPGQASMLEKAILDAHEIIIDAMREHDVKYSQELDAITRYAVRGVYVREELGPVPAGEVRTVPPTAVFLPVTYINGESREQYIKFDVIQEGVRLEVYGQLAEAIVTPLLDRIGQKLNTDRMDSHPHQTAVGIDGSMLAVDFHLDMERYRTAEQVDANSG